MKAWICAAFAVGSMACSLWAGSLEIGTPEPFVTKIVANEKGQGYEVFKTDYRVRIYNLGGFAERVFLGVEVKEPGAIKKRSALKGLKTVEDQVGRSWSSVLIGAGEPAYFQFGVLYSSYPVCVEEQYETEKTTLSKKEADELANNKVFFPEPGFDAVRLVNSEYVKTYYAVVKMETWERVEDIKIIRMCGYQDIRSLSTKNLE